MDIIVMEELDAVDFNDVLIGKKKLPKNFSLNSYDDLEEFIYEMHDLGVAHLDLYPRNLMIHRKTGKFLVIDFGRSAITTNEEARAKDLKLLDDIYDKVEEILDKNNN